MVAGLYGGRWPCHTGRRPSHHEIWLFVSSLCLHPRKIRHQPSPRQLLFSLPPMMEVDMQSPPTTFRSVAFTIKRPRSPGSPTQERQTVRAWQLFLRVCSLRLLQKRLSLAPVGLEGQCVRRAPTAPDGVVDGRAASQDDWVRQARELSIASPLSVTVGFPPAMNGSGTVAQSRVDEHMVSPLSGIRRWCSQTMLKTMLCKQAVDYEESQMLRIHVHPGSSRPWTTTRSHLPSIHITTTPTQTPVPTPNGLHALSPAPFSVLTGPPSSSTESASSTSSIPVTQRSVASAPHPCPPDIFLFPATPSDTSSHQHQLATDYGQQASGESEPGPHARMQGQSLSQSSLSRMQDRIDGSPRPSRADLPTSSGRKHRVTMGPRADCVKCRTGVRGHWMHFD
jgi:hypothetical protein